MKVEVKIRAYEARPDTAASDAEVKVESHWNQNGVLGLVHVTSPSGEKFTVAKKDLEEAIQRCVGLP